MSRNPSGIQTAKSNEHNAILQCAAFFQKSPFSATPNAVIVATTAGWMSQKAGDKLGTRRNKVLSFYFSLGCNTTAQKL